MAPKAGIGQGLPCREHECVKRALALDGYWPSRQNWPSGRNRSHRSRRPAAPPAVIHARDLYQVSKGQCCRLSRGIYWRADVEGTHRIAPRISRTVTHSD